MGFSGRQTLMDGQPNSGAYHFAVGAYAAWGGQNRFPCFVHDNGAELYS